MFREITNLQIFEKDYKKMNYVKNSSNSNDYIEHYQIKHSFLINADTTFTVHCVIIVLLQ